MGRIEDSGKTEGTTDVGRSWSARPSGDEWKRGVWEGWEDELDS